MTDTPDGVEALENFEDQNRRTGRGRSRRDRELGMLEEISRDLTLFKGTDDVEYALLPEDGGRATVVDSRGMRHSLGARVFARGAHPVMPKHLDEFILRLAEQARHGGDERAVYTRAALVGQEVWLDLASSPARFVHATPEGWSVVDQSEVAFKKPANMRELLTPTSGGMVEDLEPFINTDGDDDFKLIVGWAIGALVNEGPVPALALQGQQGSAKSTTAMALVRLLDDSAVPLRAYPSDTTSLLIATTNSRVLAFDNMSRIKPPQADDICRIVTGTAFGSRRLYTNGEEHVISAMNPLILNGIDQLAERADLISRTILIELPPIADADRLPEREFWDRFNHARPRILGALLDAVSNVLKNWDVSHAPKGARMADFVAHVTAAEEYLGWPKGSFADAYVTNQQNANQAALDSDPLSQALLDYMGLSSVGNLAEHTPTQWLDQIEDQWTDNRRQLPGNSQTLSNRLRRLAPALRDIGVIVEHYRLTDRNRTRMIRVSCEHTPAVTAHGKVLARFDDVTHRFADYAADPDGSEPSGESDEVDF